MSSENLVIENLLYSAGLTAQGCWDELDEYARDAIIRVIKMTVRECANCLGTLHMGEDYAEYILEHFGIEE